jgi:hypothetical protein
VSLLEESFVSSWSLVKELEDIAGNSSATDWQRERTRLALDSYSFPVESMVIRPEDGKVLSHINANKLLDTSASSILESIIEDPVNRNYLNFLKEGIAANQES